MNGTKLIATFIGAGLLRPAPGTWGSLAALPVAWALMTLLGPLALIPAAAAVFALGWWATAEETRGKEDHDPAEIVIDEVAGQWIALFPVALGVAHTGADLRDLWPGWIAAFVLFRLFDIWKPWLVGAADRRGDALGVMLDDVWAGVFAAVGVAVLAALAHGVLM
ncbi:MAG TPA: phosphatidylglycerophosphatase A [Albidovulum sp.]|uniref:phosphatidylglycerophosphatase A family protein n=1 Tax=Albidovulum sp. TaxID=1872424 RepID=UPI001DAA0897|nr:phosphatidylglycerophosphatase A [Paracoccaceae bacterium]HPE24550.1 phosphatidylglycerophosphatase A [Albidovulum sp.]MCB2143151.1 phosphatidylglycerophosphatase A [Paracoccaceae bacterium]MCP5323941.1 phosphatidylglycerophosphatase A [Paracoccaceae bacterium]MCP5356478.1 phosphatidylglycerophosphatase A [Paracoccaceae bacterium]